MPTEAQLEDYVGSYPLMPDFALRIFAAGARLFVQGTNQRSLELAPVEKDAFIAESVAADKWCRPSGIERAMFRMPRLRTPTSSRQGNGAASIRRDAKRAPLTSHRRCDELHAIALKWGCSASPKRDRETP